MIGPTVTAKGQVTPRKALLRHLDMQPGDKLELDLLPAAKIDAVFGLLKRPGQPVLSIEEMNEVIADKWASRR